MRASTSQPAQALLNDQQTAAFDQRYINDAEAKKVFDAVDTALSQSPSEAEPSLIDLGGGNGAFCDQFLGYYKYGSAINIELSAELAAKNTPQSRKRVIISSIFDFHEKLDADVVSFNYVLHHLITNRFGSSEMMVQAALEKARSLLKAHGLLVVFENILVGTISDRLSSRLLFEATSSRPLSRLTAAFGANTAGVGVLYLGERRLIDLAAAAGFSVTETFVLRRPRRSRVLVPVLAREIRRTGLLFRATT